MSYHLDSGKTNLASPPPRDVPRLPLSVATIATKYQSENSGESTSRWQTRSPINDLPPRSRDPGSSSAHPQQAQQFPSISSARIDSPTDELALRRRRIEELEELERRERALEVSVREREVLQRERDETLRSRVLDDYTSDTLQAHTLPPLRPQSQVLQPNRLSTTSLTSGRPAYSTTNLLPPGASAPVSPTVQRTIRDVHLPDCQCPACTVAHYAETPLTARLRPQEREKSKGGWMRRLSMPAVSNAFSSEAKAGAVAGKGISPKALGSLGEANRSVVSLGRR